MKKIKVISFLIAIFSLILAPLYITHARLNDSTAISAGIKLELGEVDLTFSNPDQLTLEHEVFEANNEPVTVQMPEIKNIGSLDGKIFFKVELFELRNGEEPTKISNPSEKKIDLMIQFGGKEQKITSSQLETFQPITIENDQPLILSPSDSTSLSFKFLASSVNNVAAYTINFLFLMTQTNGSPEKPMFHDTQEMFYQFNIDHLWNEHSAFEVKESNYQYARELPEEEKSVPTNQDEVEKEFIQNSLEQSEDMESKELLLDKEYKYVPLNLNEQTYEIGIIQEQFDWITQFATMEEFGAQISNKTSPVYIKYDKVTGIGDIEQYVYGLAEEKQLNFKIKLKNILEHNLLEITFTK